MLVALLAFSLLSAHLLAAPSKNACQSCPKNITSGKFASDVVDAASSGACATRTLTCAGNATNIKLNKGARTIADGDDGAVDGKAKLVLTCNAAGTAWTTAAGKNTTAAVVVEQAECA